jgi:5-methylcytosine-specific restriction endonuclease McrA
MAQNLGKPGKTEGCGCVHSERASLSIKEVTTRPEIRELLSTMNRLRMMQYQAENKEAIRERARVHGRTFLANPGFLAWRHELIRARRLSRGLDPDVPIASKAVLIRNATFPLRSYVLRVRDHFACVLCGATGKGKLAVHHCIPVEQDWWRVGDSFNLVTLCFDCHFRRAHGGWWKGLDPCVQVALLQAAAIRERTTQTPMGIVQAVQERLYALGRQLGRIPMDTPPPNRWQW